MCVCGGGGGGGRGLILYKTVDQYLISAKVNSKSIKAKAICIFKQEGPEAQNRSPE